MELPGTRIHGRGRGVRWLFVLALGWAVLGVGCTPTGMSNDPRKAPASLEEESTASPAAASPSDAASSVMPATSRPSTSESGQPAAAPDGAIVGTAESVDDVGEADRVPVEAATLAVLPAGDADALWEAIEFTPGEEQLPTVGGQVALDVLGPATLVAVENGRFVVDVEDGNHLVCLLDGTGPFALRGCAEVTVDGPASWRVSTGEGGFSLAMQ